MELIKLAGIFLVIIVLINFKLPLSGAVGVGAILGCLLYGFGLLPSIQLIFGAIFNKTTIMLILVTYLITFLQRMLEQRGALMQAQKCLSGIFNSRRINASVAPIFIGLLPSAAAAFIAGDMVKGATDGYLDKDEQAFVTSYFRHIPESCLPTYSSIILACALSGVAIGPFLLSMILPVALLVFLGYMFFLRKVPKETGLPPAESKAAEWLNLFKSLWTLLLAIALVIVVPYIPFGKLGFLPASVVDFLAGFPVWLAVIISIVLYFFISKFSFKDIRPYFLSALERRIVINTCVVMVFKEVLTKSNVITQLTDTLGKLPIPMFLTFALIFLLGTIVSGSSAIITLCIPPAFAAMPDGGVALFMLLMSCSYAAMQVSPTHICLTLISEYFKSDFGAIVKKTIPIISIFMVAILGYYLLLSAIF